MALNSVSEDIKTLLNDNSKGIEGTDLFAFGWGFTDNGEEINKQILVTDTGNIEALIKDEYENPTFNIMVRGGTNEQDKAVHARARDIYEFMLQQVRQTLNGNEYVQYAPISEEIIPLGKDDNNRIVYAMNFFTFRDSI